MKKKLLSLLLVLFSISFYGQINYFKGYFIDNNGVKTECYIRDSDKKDNPTSFEYKLNEESSELLKGDIKDVKEFKIENFLKYERFTVKLDTSSLNVNIDEANEIREPKWKEVTVFLETLVDSKVSLYEYKNVNLKRFFYKMDQANPEQLVHKKYTAIEDFGAKIYLNNDFQKQLWQNVNCGNKDIDEALKLKYTQKNLIKYFTEYNNCQKNSINDFETKSEPGSINLKVNGGISSSALSVHDNAQYVTADFDKKMNFTFGAEVEWVLPVNRNKWALYLAPSYNSYNNAVTTTAYNRGPQQTNTIVEKWNVKMTHLDVAFGVRYYIFISDNSRLFINGSYIVSNVLDSNIYESEYGYQLEAKLSGRVGCGIGYSFKNKFNVELKYNGTIIFNNDGNFNSNYNLTSLVFGYTIFDIKKKK